jgi:hypothetical protein
MRRPKAGLGHLHLGHLQMSLVGQATSVLPVEADNARYLSTF